MQVKYRMLTNFPKSIYMGLYMDSNFRPSKIFKRIKHLIRLLKQKILANKKKLH